MRHALKGIIGPQETEKVLRNPYYHHRHTNRWPRLISKQTEGHVSIAAAIQIQSQVEKPYIGFPHPPIRNWINMKSVLLHGYKQKQKQNLSGRKHTQFRSRRFSKLRSSNKLTIKECQAPRSPTIMSICRITFSRYITVRPIDSGIDRYRA